MLCLHESLRAGISRHPPLLLVCHAVGKNAYVPSFHRFQVGQGALSTCHRSFIQVPFLNLLGALTDRGNDVRIRVGGNTQEMASLVDSLPDNTMIAKDNNVITGSISTVRLRQHQILYLRVD